MWQMFVYHSLHPIDLQFIYIYEGGKSTPAKPDLMPKSVKSRAFILYSIYDLP